MFSEGEELVATRKFAFNGKDSDKAGAANVRVTSPKDDGNDSGADRTDVV